MDTTHGSLNLLQLAQRYGRRKIADYLLALGLQLGEQEEVEVEELTVDDMDNVKEYARTNRKRRSRCSFPDCRLMRKEHTMQLCSGCKVYYYCKDSSCNRSDWPRHKELCKMLSLRRATSSAPQDETDTSTTHRG